MLISKPHHLGIKADIGAQLAAPTRLGTIPFISKYFERREKAVSKNRYGYPRDRRKSIRARRVFPD